MKQKKRISHKGLALPHEHGGWGALFEPMIVGLMAAPTSGGLLIGLFMFGVFLVRTPLRLILLDGRRGRFTLRTRLAVKFFFGYGAAAVLLFFLALENAHTPGWWKPLAVVFPLGVVQLYFDVFNRGRELLPTVLGITVLSGLAAAIMLSAGYPLAIAAGPWLFLVCKGVASILFVKAQLMKRGPRRPSPVKMLIAHLVGLSLALVMFTAGRVHPLIPLAFTLLLIRAAWFHWAPARKVKTVGWTEILFGLVFALLIGFGYRGW